MAPPEPPPLERLLEFGAGALTDAELLAVILNPQCEDTARNLLDGAGGIDRLLQIETAALRSQGLDDGVVGILAAARELVQRGLLADTVRAQGDWWLTRADSVEAWWSARSAISLRWEPDPSDIALRDPFPIGRLLVTLEADDEGTTSVEDLWVDVVLPAVEAHVIPLVDGVSVDHTDESWGLKVRVGAMEAGDVRVVTFREAQSGTGSP